MVIPENRATSMRTFHRYFYFIVCYSAVRYSSIICSLLQTFQSKATLCSWSATVRQVWLDHFDLKQTNTRYKTNATHTHQSYAESKIYHHLKMTKKYRPAA